MKWLINPFERIAGWQALFIGLIAMALTAVIGKINNIAFDGVLDIHAGTFSFIASFAIQVVNLLSVFLTMWIAGICFSKTKVRAIDIAGTMALARAPMLLLSVICFLPIVPAGLYDIPRMIIFSIICVSFIVWMIALMYNAYTVSCHLKGVKAVVSFIGALLVAEAISKVAIYFLMSSLLINNPATGISGTNEKDEIVVTDMSDINQTAKNVAKAYEQGNFEAITAYFDETMKKALPPSGLRMGWAQVNMAYGQYKNAEIENLQELEAAGEIRRLQIPLNFGNGKLYLRLAFNSDGTICEMFIQP